MAQRCRTEKVKRTAAFGQSQWVFKRPRRGRLLPDAGHRALCDAERLEWVRIGRAALCRYKAKAAVRRAYEADCRITNARHGAPVCSDYPLELFQRVITVSLETMKIVRSLPALDIGK